MFLIPILVLTFFFMLMIDWLAAEHFYEIAKMKGHPEKKYFWWCFWIGMIGWPMVIALPDRSNIQTHERRKDSSLKKFTEISDCLIKYKKLLDEGIISQEEFDLKKKHILGN